MRINVSLYWITFSSFLSLFYFGFPLQKILAGTFSETNAGRVCLGLGWFKFWHTWTGFGSRRKVIPSKQHNLSFRKIIVALDVFRTMCLHGTFGKSIFGRYLMQFLLTFWSSTKIETCLDFQFEPALLAIILGTRSTWGKTFLPASPSLCSPTWPTSTSFSRWWCQRQDVGILHAIEEKNTKIYWCSLTLLPRATFIRNGLTKKNCSFGVCPNYLLSPLPPISTTFTTFLRRQNSSFESQFRTKNTRYTIWYTVYICNLKNN